MGDSKNTPNKKRRTRDGRGDGRRQSGTRRNARVESSRRRENRRRSGGAPNKAKNGGEAKRRNIPVTILVCVIFLIVLAYIVNAGVSLSSKAEIPSISVQMGSLDVPMLLDGIIIRSEDVYTAPMTGVVNYNYSDLDRVRRGATVCGIYNEDAVEQLAGDIDEINKAILDLQDRRSEITAFKKDVDNMNQQIKTVVDNKALPALQTDFTAVFEIKDAISQNLKLRNQMLLNESRGSLSALASDKQHYETELNKNFSNIYALESGVISYVVDGLESILTFERLNNITPEETRMKVDYDRLLRGRDVEKDAPVFKMLRSNDWYIAAYIPMEYAYDWVQGETRTIYIRQRGDFQGVDMKLEQVVAGEDNYYILFKSTKNILNFMHMRSVEFKITNSEHKGYKIPTLAIVEQTLLKIPVEYIIDDGGAYVIKHTELADEKISVTVQETDEIYCYVSQEINKLVLNDQIKLPDEPHTVHTVSDVANVKGVYVINRGYTAFKKITLDPGMPVTGDYVILDPEVNREIRLHDRIISDAKTVNVHEKVVE